jgi:hypothetical protein
LNLEDDSYSPSRIALLTNLKSHLIIRISKGLAVDGKRETKRRDEMKIGYVRVSKQERDEALQWGIA